MTKTFYTEKDIEDLARQGVTSLVVDESVVLTELAWEKAERLGVELVREHETPPSAPVRPYIAAQSPRQAAAKSTSMPTSSADLHARVRKAVVTRLGDEVDPDLLDAIIRRVLDNVGLK